MEEKNQQPDSSQASHAALHHSDLPPPYNSLNTPQPPVPSQLLYPVIIPQRRPSDRSRGFIKAYAPDLARCGIDQATFLAFLDGFDKVMAASPWVGGVNLAGAAVGAVPSAIASGVGLAVQVTAGIYKEVQSRKVQNEYLLKMNDELFQPRGLYCLVMAYAPAKHSGKSAVRDGGGLDGGTVLQRPDSTSSRLRSNDGVTEVIDIAASAELIYPNSEDAAEDELEQEDESSWKSGFSKMMDKSNERKDYKAQVKYLKKNPGSDLGPLMSHGIVLSSKDLEKQAKKQEKEERKQGKEERKREKRERKHPEKEPKKRKLKKGILYLMIVNMPSEDEMESARGLIERGVVA